jgi:death-on-curing protein
MNYLSAKQVLFIHARLISETGGAHGVRDLGLLQSAVRRPQATFDGQDLYPGLFSKSAALMESLVGNHPFVDGNKRTAISASGLFLRVNGYRLTADNQQLQVFVLQCAQGLISLEQMAVWLESHSERIPIHPLTHKAR